MKALRTLISDWLFWLARKVKPRRKPGPPKGRKRTPNLPGARERILAPWKGAVEVNEYTLVRSKPIQGDNDGQ